MFQIKDESERHLLRTASRLWRIQTSFTGADGKGTDASERTLLLLLQAVSGEEIRSRSDLNRLIRLARALKYDRVLEPVHILWANHGEGLGQEVAFELDLTVRESSLRPKWRFTLTLESGEEIAIERIPFEMRSNTNFDCLEFTRGRVRLSATLPIGYHKIALDIGDSRVTSHLIRAPTHAGALSNEGLIGRTQGSGRSQDQGQTQWGAFAPVYGLKSSTDWGIGDVTVIERAQDFLHEQGAAFFGTLPLLPTLYEGDDCDPSPYTPVSRLFWNEIYLDVEFLVTHSRSDRARTLIDREDVRTELSRLRNEPNVEYPSVFRLKKKVLSVLAEDFFGPGGEKNLEFDAFVTERPEVLAYAEFRSRGVERERLYHLYTQYQMDRSMRHLALRAKRQESAGLYLDYPVGVSRGGFDAQVFASCFLNEANAGAPPDPIFMGGQDWGFAPLHPIRIREEGYDYVIKCFRHHMKFASVLRVDHIMAFHRIYAIPRGLHAKEGAYIRYCPDEFYAVLGIEASRSGVRVVGEDLGTVPSQVRTTLERHDFLRMWVLPFEAGNDPMTASQKAPEKSLVCLNTHDMAPFAGFAVASDIEILDQLNLLDHARSLLARTERKEQIDHWAKALDVDIDRLALSLLEILASCPAELCLINIEDLWGETNPQNVPGTFREMPNWRRKLRVAVEEWAREPTIVSALQLINEARKKGRLSRDERRGAGAVESSRNAGEKNDFDAGRSPSV